MLPAVLADLSGRRRRTTYGEIYRNRNSYVTSILGEGERSPRCGGVTKEEMGHVVLTSWTDRAFRPEARKHLRIRRERCWWHSDAETINSHISQKQVSRL